MLIIVDLQTKYLYVRGLKEQRDMHTKFDEYCSLMKRLDVKHRRVHLGLSKMVTDSAMNLMSEKMKAWQASRHIVDWQSAPYTQNQNYVESKIQHLFAGGIANLSSSGFPHMLLVHMTQMKADAMNAHWVHGSELSPMEARFGIRAHIKNFFPPGAVMYVYINEQLRAKGEDHGEVLYWCDRPESGGGGLGFCPRRCTVYTRRHFNVDPRFVYGMCVGGKFEQTLKLHSKARRWSEKDARALTDDRYRNNLLEQMMRQGLAHLSPHEVEQRQELVKQAIELMNSDDRMQLVSEVVEKRMKQIGSGDNADSERALFRSRPDSGRERMRQRSVKDTAASSSTSMCSLGLTFLPSTCFHFHQVESTPTRACGLALLRFARLPLLLARVPESPSVSL